MQLHRNAARIIKMWKISEPKHDSKVIELCQALYREDPSTNPSPDGTIEKTISELRKNPTRGMTLALEVNQEVVGYALLISFWSNELGGEVCFVDELYVHPKARGQGFATELIQLLSQKNNPWNRTAVALQLEVTPKNEKAFALYSRLGFKNVENVSMRKLKGGPHLLVERRVISPTPKSSSNKP